ncbi:ROK family protein [Rhizobium sp. RU36D]|uniref:ROK family protein n=1 Tax=Rhizobium sp. RU36D TaxID=1907415 RepID=UPI0009D84E5C|nr:ROK family protein [Rhizobium sp. RU36D]SMC64395.1 hypothetical protein SAMN05880593_10435 [Rhizobium sp. RU36D]
MTKSVAKTRDAGSPIAHGLDDLPAVTVDDYNLERRDKDGFIGDKANKSAFAKKIDLWRKSMAKAGGDPLGEKPTSDYSKKDFDALLRGEDVRAAALVMGAVEDFAQELAKVLTRYLADSAWKNTQRIAVGGGFKESFIGALAIARAMALLNMEGINVELSPIKHHPDDAGLIGAAHLMPAWMLKGHEAILAVDIGGTNIRAGVVKLKMDDKPDLSKAKVWKSEIWRHADEDPARTHAVAELIRMLTDLIDKAEKAGLSPAPVIGLACPGLIRSDGSIERGGQNLPGGNWESKHFNLPAEIMKAIPSIGGRETFVIMHNDAVVQGLSQVPFMQDVAHWGVVTIGTGLGNARFSNKQPPKKEKE